MIVEEVEINGEVYERTKTKLFQDTSGRGFGVIAFGDKNMKECSIQDSSLATEPAIWLGINNPDPKILVQGEGWKDYSIDPNVLISTRMHLTQNMVKQLLPFLIDFAETGEYITKNHEYLSLPKKEV